MGGRTRKNKQRSGKKSKRHTRSASRKRIALLGEDADLKQVIAKLNSVITLCCQSERSAPHHSEEHSKKHSKKHTTKSASKKRGKNEFFTKMLAAKKSKAPSFEYNGNTYKATKGGNAGQLVVYKKA